MTPTVPGETGDPEPTLQRDVTEWGFPVAKVYKASDGWRIRKPRGCVDAPTIENATYPSGRIAADVAMMLYGDVVVEVPR